MVLERAATKSPLRGLRSGCGKTYLLSPHPIAFSQTKALVYRMQPARFLRRVCSTTCAFQRSVLTGAIPMVKKSTMEAINEALRMVASTPIPTGWRTTQPYPGGGA